MTCSSCLEAFDFVAHIVSMLMTRYYFYHQTKNIHFKDRSKFQSQKRSRIVNFKMFHTHFWGISKIYTPQKKIRSEPIFLFPPPSHPPTDSHLKTSAGVWFAASIQCRFGSFTGAKTSRIVVVYDGKPTPTKKQ